METNNSSLETTEIPTYIVHIFVFTALIHYMLVGIAVIHLSLYFYYPCAQAGDVIGLVSVYIYIRTCSYHQKKIVIERTRDLIYLKFVATDFFSKIISPLVKTPVT